MNIVIVGTAYPLRGGIAHYVALLYRNLSRRHKVSIVTFSRQYPGFLFPGKSQKEQGGGESVRVPAEALIDSINPFTWRTAARRIAALQPDLVIFKYWLPFFGPCFGYIARRVKELTGGKARVACICDNIIPHERRPFDRTFTNYAFRSFDGCIVQSTTVEKDLKRLYPGKPFRHVPHPIYDIFGRPVAKKDAKHRLGLRDDHVMLFFGYVRRYKGLHILLKAMPEIVRRIRVKLLVVGEFYGDEQDYRRMVRDLKLEKDVDIRPEYVPNDQVAPYFCASDVVVLPYVSATQSGIVQIAYNFDKPVIATNVGGLSEVVIDGKSGSIVPPEDPRAFADAVVRYYKERLEGTYVRGIHEEKKKYSWEHLVRGLEELHRDIGKQLEEGRARKQLPTSKGQPPTRKGGWTTAKGQSPTANRQEPGKSGHQSGGRRDERRGGYAGRRDSGQAPRQQDPRRHETTRQSSTQQDSTSRPEDSSNAQSPPTPHQQQSQKQQGGGRRRRRNRRWHGPKRGDGGQPTSS